MAPVIGLYLSPFLIKLHRSASSFFHPLKLGIDTNLRQSSGLIIYLLSKNWKRVGRADLFGLVKFRSGRLFRLHAAPAASDALFFPFPHHFWERGCCFACGYTPQFVCFFISYFLHI